MKIILETDDNCKYCKGKGMFPSTTTKWSESFPDVSCTTEITRLCYCAKVLPTGHFANIGRIADSLLMDEEADAAIQEKINELTTSQKSTPLKRKDKC